MSNNVNGYISYFRNLAINHTSLRHDLAGEAGDSEAGAVRFAKITTDEVLTGLRSKVGWPCLFVELYEIDTNSEVEYDIRQRSRGAFMVLDSPQSHTFAAEQVCYEKAEEIIYGLLKQIWQDHYGKGTNRCTTPFKFFSFDKLHIMPVGPLFDREFGYRVEFDFQFQNTVNFSIPPGEDTFLKFVIDNDSSYIIIP